MCKSVILIDHPLSIYIVLYDWFTIQQDIDFVDGQVLGPLHNELFIDPTFSMESTPKKTHAHRTYRK